MFDNMIERIEALMRSGTAAKDIRLEDISTLSAEALAAIRAEEVKETTRADGIVIAFAYRLNVADHGEENSYMRRATEMASDQFFDEYCDWAGLTVLRNKSFKNEDGFDKLVNLHHTWNASFAEHKQMCLIDTSNNSVSVPDFLTTNLREDVAHVYLPSTYTDNTSEVSGHVMRECHPDYRDANLTDVEVGGVVVGGVGMIGETKIMRAYVVPADLYAEDGQMLFDSLGPNTHKWYTDMIATALVTGDAAVVAAEGYQVSREEREQFANANIVLSLINDGVGDREEKLQQLQNRIDELVNRENEYLQEYSQASAARREKVLEFADLNAGDITGIINESVTAIRDLQLVQGDEPVKSATIRRDKGRTIIAVELHPLCLDTLEQEDYQKWIDQGNGADYLNGKGAPSHRLLEHIKFEVDFSQWREGTSAIKFINPNNEYGRVHPHVYRDGHACWGNAARPITDAFLERRWHDGFQWLYTFFGGMANDAGHTHMTEHWKLPAAPEGLEPGWIIPGTDRFEQYEAAKLATA